MELIKLKENITCLNYKNSNLIMDFTIVMLIAVLYLALVVLLNQREVFLSIVLYLSIATALTRIYYIIKHDDCDLVFILIKLFCSWLLTNVLVRNHNPFYHCFLFWLPFDEFFRGVIILKMMNIIFELELRAIKKYRNKSSDNEEKNKPSDEHFLHNTFIPNYEIFNELYMKFFSFHSNKLIFVLFLIFLKISYFFISDYYLPNNYHTTIKTKKYFICANLFNNEPIMEDWTVELKKLINYLGKEKVYVSILENGDSKDNTAKKLNEFKSELNEMNVQNLIITERIINKKSFNRIGFLQRIRNKVIEPMLKRLNWKPDEFLIIFINDIIYKWQDIIKLIMTNEMQYDMACGLDIYYGFYDVWVSRDLNGNKLRNYYPYFTDRNAQNRVINGENIRVFSCWNGVAIINPEPFYKVPNLAFRDGRSIKESECFYLCQDFWKNGYNKIILNPNVKFTYEYLYYYWNRYFAPILSIHSYFYYYFNYIFEFDPNSGNLNDNNIVMNKEWKFYT
jgi:hypothetical protein